MVYYSLLPSHHNNKRHVTTDLFDILSILNCFFLFLSSFLLSMQESLLFKSFCLFSCIRTLFATFWWFNRRCSAWIKGADWSEAALQSLNVKYVAAPSYFALQTKEQKKITSDCPIWILGKHNYVNVLVPTLRDYCTFPIMWNCSLDAEMS